MAKKWLPFYIFLSVIVILFFCVLFTLEIITPPSFLSGMFLGIRAALANFELRLISLFS